MLSPVIGVRPSGRCKGLVAPARNRWPVLGPQLCQIKHNERRVGAMRCRREWGRSVVRFGSGRAGGQGGVRPSDRCHRLGVPFESDGPGPDRRSGALTGLPPPTRVRGVGLAAPWGRRLSSPTPVPTLRTGVVPRPGARSPMSQRGGLAVYVTSHGFGHLNRSVAVINRMPPEVPVTIRCHPNLFDHWRERLRRRRSLEAHVSDVGAVNPPGDSATTDGAATLELAARVHAEAMARVDDEARQLRDERDGRRRFATSPPVPLVAARRAGVPGLPAGQLHLGRHLRPPRQAAGRRRPAAGRRAAPGLPAGHRAVPRRARPAPGRRGPP